jgi:hypothetical protein
LEKPVKVGSGECEKEVCRKAVAMTSVHMMHSRSLCVCCYVENVDTVRASDPSRTAG